jgi:hypothetical protein
MPDPRLPRVHDDWTVWAFSDAHGVTSGLVAGLQEAGILDEALHWVAPPRTALVGCGDYIDRGGDVRGTVDLLARLSREAEAAGGRALFARGNHEQMLLMLRDGRHSRHDDWLHFGGLATLDAYGMRSADGRDPERVIAHLEGTAPDLLAWLGALPQAVRWRDVLFVHGGLAPGHGPEDLGLTTEEHLWVRATFYEAPLASEAFSGYRRAGIERVVFGHTPQREGARTFHGGRSLCLDSNAVGNDSMPRDAVRQLTLVRLAGDDRFERAPRVIVPTRHAPDRRRPGLVDGPGIPRR